MGRSKTYTILFHASVHCLIDVIRTHMLRSSVDEDLYCASFHDAILALSLPFHVINFQYFILMNLYYFLNSLLKTLRQSASLLIFLHRAQANILNYVPASLNGCFRPHCWMRSLTRRHRSCFFFEPSRTSACLLHLFVRFSSFRITRQESFIRSALCVSYGV